MQDIFLRVALQVPSISRIIFQAWITKLITMFHNYFAWFQSEGTSINKYVFLNGLITVVCPVICVEKYLDPHSTH